MSAFQIKSSFKWHKWLRATRGYVVLFIFALLFLTPFYWMFATALKGSDQVFQLPPAWVPNPLVWDSLPDSRVHTK